MRKIAANRVNGRKSRGPRTSPGKARSSQNALRHGLSRINYDHPNISEHIERLVRALCPDEPNTLLLEQARRIAESEMMLRLVRIQQTAAIERFRDRYAKPLVRKDIGRAAAKATLAKGELAFGELERLRAIRRANIAGEALSKLLAAGCQISEDPPCDEYHALREALPDLDRLDRYEKRAWSRRNRAVRAFVAIRERETWSKMSEKAAGEVARNYAEAKLQCLPTLGEHRS